jgi:hypothetical protein
MSSGGEKNVEELKKLVIHTLETNGVLGQLRAQLRANVYKAIDEERKDEDESHARPKQETSVKLMQSPIGPLMAEIVAEFFEFYEFRHSMSVFIPEAHLKRERRSRTDVALDAGLTRVLADVSILEQLLTLATSASEVKQGDGYHSSASSTTASSPPPAAMTSSTMPRSPLAADNSAVPVLKELKSPKGTAQAQGTDKASRLDNPIGSRSKNLDSIVSPGGGGSPKATSGTGEESDQSGSTSETCDRAPEEVNSTRRNKLGRKLPAMGGTKEHLPALKASQQNFPSASDRNSGVGSPSGDFSLGDSSMGVSGESFEEIHGNIRDYQQLNRRLARAKGKSVTVAPSATSPTTSPTGRDAPGRDGLGSPTTSPSNHDMDRSSALSGARSPEVDNLSDRNSVLSGSRSPEGIHARNNHSNSRSGSPATSPHSSAHSGHSGGTPQSEAQEDIVSLDGDDNSGSGSIDLALGRGTSGDTAPFGTAASTGIASRSMFDLRSSQAPALDNDHDDSIEEDVDNFEENSHSGYESSERSGGF